MYGNGAEAAQTQYVYDSPAVSAAGITVGRDTAYNGNTTVARSNLTQKTEVLLNGCSGCANPVTGYTNDDTGQRLTMKDARGNTTSYSYADSYASGTPPGATDAYLSKVTYPTTQTDNPNHIESFKYNYADGQLASSTDQNSQVTSYFYGEGSDELDRLTGINYPDCTSCSSATHSVTHVYDDAAPTPSVTTTKLATPDPSMVSETIMDGLGHAIETLVTSVTPNIRTDTAFDGLGRVHTVSNAYYVGSSSPSDGTTTYTYDAVGRTTNVQYADANNAATSYAANCATVTDPATKKRQSCSDGLGRLTQVTEDPGGLGYVTSYSYDALDNLTAVTQGSLTRSFHYDSLSRLTSATNPESGTVNYSNYDGNGNLLTRTDARNITTTYSYDALNRLTQKSYSDGTPSALFGYDQSKTTIGSYEFNVGYGIGRLSYTFNNPNIMDAYSYDPTGRIVDFYNCTPNFCGGTPWHTHYAYDLAGGVSSWTHPGGFTLTHTLDGAQRVTQVGYSPSDSTHPNPLVQSLTYTPFGAVGTLEDGCAGTGCSNAEETYIYNNRLQPVVIESGTTQAGATHYGCLVYNYYQDKGNPTSCQAPVQGSQNNGNVMGYYYQDSTGYALGHTASFTYDCVNRLTNAQASGGVNYKLPFSYTQDGSNGQYGNMTCVMNQQTQAGSHGQRFSDRGFFQRGKAHGWKNANRGYLLLRPEPPVILHLPPLARSCRRAIRDWFNLR